MGTRVLWQGGNGRAVMKIFWIMTVAHCVNILQIIAFTLDTGALQCMWIISEKLPFKTKQKTSPVVSHLRVEPRLFQWPYQSTYHLPTSLSDSSSCPLLPELCSIHRSSLALPSKAAVLCRRCVCNLLLALLPDGQVYLPLISISKLKCTISEGSCNTLLNVTAPSSSPPPFL